MTARKAPAPQHVMVPCASCHGQVAADRAADGGVEGTAWCNGCGRPVIVDTCNGVLRARLPRPWSSLAAGLAEEWDALQAAEAKATKKSGSA